MSTYLELCQRTAFDSGTVGAQIQPATVAGVTGRLLRVCRWVDDAYQDIQQMHQQWRWLQSDFSGNTIVGTQNYNAAAMGIADRFDHWIYRGEDEAMSMFSIYKTSEGQASEVRLTFVDWERMRDMYLIGAAASTTGTPQAFSINPANEITLYPIPDDTYTIRGRYYKAPQELTADADTPEMPAQFHKAIKWKALLLMGTFDEAITQFPVWQRNLDRVIFDIEADQLPRMKLGAPLY